MREALDVVLFAEPRRIHHQLTGGLLDDPLDDEGRFRPPGAAIGIDRCRIGVDRVDLAIDRRNVVLAGEQRRVEIGGHRGCEGREIGTEIGDRIDPEGQDFPGVVGGEFGVGDMVAPMRVREERFRSIRRPLDRPLDLLRGPHADRFLGVDEDLGAESAPDIGRDHAELVLGRDPDEGREHEPCHMRVLARRVERVIVGAEIILADRRPRLDRVGDEPVVDEIDPRDVLGLGEGLLGRGPVAEMPAEHGVVRRDLVHLRARLLRVGHIDDGREQFVVDGDLLGGVLRLRKSLCDDDGDLVADVAHLALRQRRMGAGLHRRPILRMNHPAADQPADLVRREILARIDPEHPRHRPCSAGIDRADRRVGVRRPQEIGIGLARPVHIVDVAALARDEALVLLAAHRSTDPCG
jgi:hypothetical protein